MIRASLLRFVSFFRTAQHGPDFERFTMNQSATHREAAAKLRLNDVQRKELLASHGAILVYFSGTKPTALHKPTRHVHCAQQTPGCADGR
jgi:hypothetical protein